MSRMMRWDCQKGENCFNEKARLALGEFDECFPRNIGMGDIDGLVEVNRRYLMLEWKHESILELPKGQKILFEHLCEDGKFTIFVVFGDYQKRKIDRLDIYHKGTLTTHREGETMEKLKWRMKGWAESVLHPAFW
jgi:hypothetical protein